MRKCHDVGHVRLSRNFDRCRLVPDAGESLPDLLDNDRRDGAVLPEATLPGRNFNVQSHLGVELELDVAAGVAMPSGDANHERNVDSSLLVLLDVTGLDHEQRAGVELHHAPRYQTLDAVIAALLQETPHQEPVDVQAPHAVLGKEVTHETLPLTLMGAAGGVSHVLLPRGDSHVAGSVRADIADDSLLIRELPAAAVCVLRGHLCLHI